MSDDQAPPPPPATQVEVNPYAPPTTDPTREACTMSEAEALRGTNLLHEASIKGIGALILIGGLLIIYAAVYSLAAASDAADLILGLMTALIGMGQIMAGWSLRRFEKGGRIVCSVLCALMLLAVPLGTVMGAYFLYVFLGSKGSLIFSDRYQVARRQTPHIKYRSPPWMWVLLAILILLLAVLIIFLAMSS